MRFAGASAGAHVVLCVGCVKMGNRGQGRGKKGWGEVVIIHTL